LHPVERQDDPALFFEEGLQAGVIRKTQGEEFFVAVEQIGNTALAKGHVALLEKLMYLRDASMRLVARGSYEGDHVQSALGLWESEGSLFPGAYGMFEGRAVRLATLPDGQPQVQDAFQGEEASVCVIGDPHGMTAFPAVEPGRFQSSLHRRVRLGMVSGHDDALRKK